MLSCCLDAHLDHLNPIFILILQSTPSSIIFLISSLKHYCAYSLEPMTTRLNRLVEAVLMNTQTLCFGVVLTSTHFLCLTEIRKNTMKSSVFTVVMIAVYSLGVLRNECIDSRHLVAHLKNHPTHL